MKMHTSRRQQFLLRRNIIAMHPSGHEYRLHLRGKSKGQRHAPLARPRLEQGNCIKLHRGASMLQGASKLSSAAYVCQGIAHASRTLRKLRCLQMLRILSRFDWCLFLSICGKIHHVLIRF